MTDPTYEPNRYRYAALAPGFKIAVFVEAGHTAQQIEEIPAEHIKMLVVLLAKGAIDDTAT
jgi:hypothetical protein